MQSIDTGRQPEDPATGSEPAAAATSRADRSVEREELRALVETALAKLPRRQRTVMQLHDVREMRMREIGVSLGVSQNRVSQMRREALEQLKWELRCLGIRSTAAVC
ncbi:MAG: sigma-70 family RNA polymerase sigma factor [Acidobacteriales bacterium]|nr:sigma-70 family RNA polymerase sigma factor [Terriglobales bacterium]